MSPRRKKHDQPPRQVGDFLITEAVAPPRRKWTPPKGDPLQGQLWPSDSNSPVARKKASAAAARAAEGAPAGEGTAARDAAGVAPLFQSNGHCCDQSPAEFPTDESRVYGPEGLGDVVGTEYRLRSCRCRKWFCEGCGPRMGWKLRNRILERLEAFTDVYGITLTVDGKLFDSPEAAWQYVMDNRYLARLVRELDKRGHLHAPDYVWVVEFQEKTEQPHWHMLLDATNVPYGEIVEVWSRYRPKSAEPLFERITAANYQGQAPAFGSVRFTHHANRRKAGYYSTKYLCKHPQNGYPDWVLDRVGRMPRFGHSRGFFPQESKHDALCFCAECRGEAEPATIKTSKPKKSPSSSPSRRKPEPKTIRERVAECGQSCNLVQVERVQFTDGVVIDGRGKFEGKVPLSLDAACEWLGVSPEERWQLELTGEEATALEEYAREREEGGESP